MKSRCIASIAQGIRQEMLWNVITLAGIDSTLCYKHLSLKEQICAAGLKAHHQQICAERFPTEIHKYFPVVTSLEAQTKLTPICY